MPFDPTIWFEVAQSPVRSRRTVHPDPSTYNLRSFFLLPDVHPNPMGWVTAQAMPLVHQKWERGPIVPNGPIDTFLFNWSPNPAPSPGPMTYTDPLYHPFTPSLNGVFFFPALPTVGWSVHKMPKFATIAYDVKSGRDVTYPQQVYPHWEFTLTYEVLRDMNQNQSPWGPELPFTELEQIASLFMSCAGQFGWFYYSDPSDNTRAKGPVGTGDGTSTVFTVFHYFGPQGFADPVGSLQTVTNVYLNNVVTSPSNYTVSGNQITFTSAPGSGVVITADYAFYFVCRFIEDGQDYEQFMSNLWTLKSCKFRSIIR